MGHMIITAIWRKYITILTLFGHKIYGKEMGIPCQLYYRQYGHGGPPPMKMMNRWFTRYLHGIENGVENDTTVWIVRESDKMDNPTPYVDYPNPDASPVTLYLNPGAPERGSLSSKKADSKAKETLVDNYSYSGSCLAQAEITEHRLIYVTPELLEDIHISGIPRVTV